MSKRGSKEWRDKISKNRKGKIGGVFPGDLNPMKRAEVREKASKTIQELWKQPYHRRKWCEARKRTTSIEHMRMLGKRSRLHENQVAAKLGGIVFQPNEVCDRIVVQDGKVLFIEIKQIGRKLSEKQQLFQSIVGDSFKVLYS